MSRWLVPDRRRFLMSRWLVPDRRRLLIGAALTAPALILPKETLAVLSSRSLVAPDDGLFQAPYSAQSPWKAQPVNPTLGSGVMSSNQYAYVPFQAPIYYARASDPSATIVGPGGGTVNVPDEITHRNIILPHFPAGVVLPPGSDAEVVIYDTTTELLHSFFQMAYSGRQWTANTYAVESATGWGFGTPSRPFNIRASGSSPIAGVLRNWELPSNTGTYPQHALALGLGTDAVLADNYTSPSPPGPIYPATNQDAGFIYTGTAPNAWPMGTLFMLPSSFDVGSLSAPGAIAVAKTLMKFGAYLVDASYNTCGFYCEFNPDLIGWPGISYGLGRSNADFVTIRNALRAVTAVEGWLDGNGNSWTPPNWAQMQLLSMRGPWSALSGTVSGGFDTTANFFVAPTSAPFIARRKIQQPSALSSGGRWQNWADSGGWFTAPTPGQQYTLSVIGSGALMALLSIWDQTVSTNYFTSSAKSPGQQQTFSWPNQSSFVTLLQVSNPGAGGRIRMELVAA
jgi:hypothetical protein